MTFEVGLVLGILIGLGAGGVFVWRATTAAAEEWVRDNAPYFPAIDNDWTGWPRR